MSATGIFIIGIVAAATLVAAGVFVVAYRRGPSSAPLVGELDEEALRRDEERRRARQLASVGAAAPAQETPPAPALPEAPPRDPLTEREEITPEEFLVTRRQFFNRTLVAIFTVFLAQFGIASLAFLWPKLKGGFGTPINLGNVDDLRAEILQGDGTAVPKFEASAQTWLVPFRGELEGSSFEEIADLVIAGAEDGEPGLMALWQRCVHLGCRVPSCVPSQGFECPCHGSKYNLHGEYEAGPAPRNLDRFEVKINDANELIVNTGAIFQTPRAQKKTIKYPQGPFCV